MLCTELPAASLNSYVSGCTPGAGLTVLDLVVVRWLLHKPQTVCDNELKVLNKVHEQHARKHQPGVGMQPGKLHAVAGSARCPTGVRQARRAAHRQRRVHTEWPCALRTGVEPLRTSWGAAWALPAACSCCGGVAWALPAMRSCGGGAAPAPPLEPPGASTSCVSLMAACFPAPLGPPAASTSCVSLLAACSSASPRPSAGVSFCVHEVPARLYECAGYDGCFGSFLLPPLCSFPAISISGHLPSNIPSAQSKSMSMC